MRIPFWLTLVLIVVGCGSSLTPQQKTALNNMKISSSGDVSGCDYISTVTGSYTETEGVGMRYGDDHTQYVIERAEGKAKRSAALKLATHVVLGEPDITDGKKKAGAIEQKTVTVRFNGKAYRCK